MARLRVVLQPRRLNRRAGSRRQQDFLQPPLVRLRQRLRIDAAQIGLDGHVQPVHHIVLPPRLRDLPRVVEATAKDLEALPWTDPALKAARVAELAVADDVAVTSA